MSHIERKIKLVDLFSTKELLQKNVTQKKSKEWNKEKHYLFSTNMHLLNMFLDYIF